MCTQHLKGRGVLAAILLALVSSLAGCEGQDWDNDWILQGARPQVPKIPVPGGDPAQGARVIREIGCGACHHIPGIPNARGVVGPPLLYWSRRSYIAGSLPNSPANLIRWVMNAPAVEPETAMPNLDLNEQQARDVAAYLYTLD